MPRTGKLGRRVRAKNVQTPRMETEAFVTLAAFASRAEGELFNG